MTDPAASQPYADHVVAYAQAGWSCILPVPPATKTPPPVGFTGAAGRDTDPLTLVDFATRFPSHSIALRMPESVIGIDVDAYVKGSADHQVTKHGAETLAAFVERWGPLPATWTSTARGEGPSRIHFFRVPPRRYATKLDTGTTSDIEIIQRHHRYAVVWPSPHPGAGEGAIYRWYDPQGLVVDAPPKPEELPELPAAWVEGLAAGATEAGPVSADHASGQVLLDQLLEDWRPECADITSVRLQAVEELSGADVGSRYDTMLPHTHHLIQMAASGHAGVARAIAELREHWSRLTAGEDREGEFDRMLLTSARKAVTLHGAHQVPRDPCLFIVGFPVAGPAPEDDRPADPENPPLEGIEPGRWYSVREAIGADSFDPNAGLDQPLAEAVLQRMYPALRYAYDSRTWLLRVPERWEERRELAPWAVAQLAPLMPVGDPTAEKGSEPYERAKRRARLMSTPGAKAVAGKIDALVRGGTHPASVRLGALDSDPEILWAGGMPYSLRRSHDGPTLATLDPATPHLHAAGVTPELRPTPLWDAFLASVWPDPEVRRWAMRVLSIALTGYADRALPILLGETGRGKTQVVHLLMSVLGSYAHAANPKLLGSGSNEHDTIVYALKGRRLSFIDEAPSEARSGQERLKQLTGGGELTARQMNADPITFAPTHTLVLTANDEPVLTDPAIRSRARLIPCEGDPEAVRLARAAIGHVKGSAWRAEAPGVLAALMAEAAGWLSDQTSAHTAAAPESIRYLAENFGAEQDPVWAWVNEETEPSEEGTAARELYQAFTASCMRNNLRRDAIPSETKWGRALTRLGFPSVHTEHGKRRKLRVRAGGGFLPGMGPAPTSTATADGLTPNPDGLLTGSEANPSGTKPQVNPRLSVDPDGSDGLNNPLTYMRAPTHAQGSRPPADTEPVSRTTEQRGVTCGNAPGGTRQANPSGEKPRQRKPADPDKAAAAREKRAQASAERRLAAIAEAAGPMVPLPALVTRDGAVRSCMIDDADQLLTTISGDPAGELTVDVEHTGYPLGHRDFALRSIQLGNEVFTIDLDPTDADQADVARRHLADAAVLHAHSAIADLVPLAAAGLLDLEDAWRRMLDTAVLAKLADPASTGNDADLKSLSKAVLGEAALSPGADAARKALFKAGKWLTDTEVTTPLEKSGWAQVDPSCETMIRYATADVLDDAALARRLPQPPPAVLERERATQRMTARVAFHGVRLDGDQVDRLLETHTAARAEHASAVRAYGIENPGSNPQIGEAFARLGAALPRTSTGKPSVAVGVLEPLRNRDDEIGRLAASVLDYRHHDTAIGLFLEPYRELVRHGDGRARPTVHTLGADTGRMSCVRPNLQQVPRAGGFRACITADPGHVLVSADFAGVELRVAAALSQDASLRAILDDPERDLHWEIARIAFGPEATKGNRYAVKRGVFGRIYGGGVGAIAAGVGVSQAVAHQIIDAMDQLTPGLTAWSAMVRDGVEAGRTQFPTAAGRIIHLPTRAPHAAPNYCIQGTARELLVDALMRWSDTPWGDAVLWPVHDELVVHVPEADAEAATAALVACMTTDLAGVPIIAEPSAPSYAWSDSE